jgi:hypothetical protein
MTRARDVANIDGILTTKGDIYAASAAATPARLGVGSNGDTLVADSSTSTGLRYTAGNPIPNPVLNSSFQIAQRGTSFSTASASAAYTLDRWRVRTTGANTANTVSRQNTNDTTNLPNIQYCARVQRNSGQTGTNFLIFEQGFETVNSIPFSGKTVTLSFYARAGANYSSTSNVLIASLVNGTGTDQMPDVYTGGNYPTQNNTLTTTWQRFTYTLTVPTTSTELGIQLYYNPSGTAGANDYFEVTGVQLDISSVALPFRTNGATIQGELAACQRYYWRINANEAYSPFGNGAAQTTTKQNAIVYFPTIMRTKPSSVDFSALNVLNPGVAGYAVTALTQSEGNVKGSFLNVTVASGLTANSFYALSADATSNGYLGFSAEL